MADDELLDVLDERGEPVGVERRDVVHRDGLWHRAFHLWVLSGPDVLLQRRSAAKATHPGMLDATAAGHLGAGEGVLEGGLREVREELGVAYRAPELTELGVWRIEDRVGPGGRLVNREHHHVWAVRDPRPLEGWTALDPVEVDGLVALRLEDLGAYADGAAGPWPARAWDGRRVEAVAVAREEVIPAVHLPELLAALARLPP